MSVVNRIAELRDRFDVSQDDLARLAGVERSTLSRIENGHHEPTAESCWKISRALGLSVEEVFDLAPPDSKGWEAVPSRHSFRIDPDHALLICRDGDDAWLVSWSTVCDAPISAQRLPRSLRSSGDKRLARALNTGTSFERNAPRSGEDAALFNRAGKNETRLTYDQMLATFRENAIDDPPLGFESGGSEEALEAWCVAQERTLEARGLLVAPGWT